MSRSFAGMGGLASIVLGLAVTHAAAEPAARRIFFRDQAVELIPYPDRLAVAFSAAVPADRKQQVFLDRSGAADVRVDESIPRPAVDVLKLEKADADRVIPHVRELADGGQIEHASLVYRSYGVDLIPTGEVFVQFAPGIGAERVQEVARELHVELVKATSWRSDNFLLRATAESPGDAIEVSERLLDCADVVFSQPNFIRRLHRFDEPNDAYFTRQWALHNTGSVPGGVVDVDLDAPEAWCINHGCDVVIAILDEGCDMNHPDLMNKYLVGSGYDAADGDNHPQPMPWDGHGTASAGIAAAETNNFLGVAGVNWEAAIMPIRIAYSPWPGTNWVTTDQWISDSIAHAWTNGADVLSNSYGGGPPSEQIHAAIRDAIIYGRGGLGSVVVFAAGNDDQPQSSYPGLHPEAISVAATSPCDERKSPSSCDGETWWGSNYNYGVDLAAPGVKIATTDIVGGDGYCPSGSGSFDCSGGNDYVMNFNGTSSATPYVAGVASMVICKYPFYTEKEVRSRLEQTCDKVGGYAYDPITGWSAELGHGRVNLYRALTGKPQVVGGPGNNWPSIYRDAADAPLPYGSLGTLHDSAACEWLGEEYSPEVHRVDPLDPDGVPNLGNKDAFDDGVAFHPPYIPGQVGQVDVTVSVENWQALRFQTATHGTLYINVWFDWESDGSWNNTYDRVVTDAPVMPSTFGANSNTFTFSFIVPDVDVSYHLQSAAPAKFMNVRTRLSCEPLPNATAFTECGEVEDDQFLNFVEMFLIGPGHMNIFSYGCDPWSWASGFEPWTCHPPFIGNGPTGYMTAEVYNPNYYGDYHSGLRTPSFDLSELTEAYLEYDFSAVELVTGYVNIYVNGVLDSTPRVYPQNPLALCNVFHDIIDLTSYCDDPYTDVVIEFKTYPPDPCPTLPLPEYQDWKLDNVVVWGRDVIAPAPRTATVTPLSTETADITWTAPGDDGLIHRAELYNIRYGPKAITPTNWRHSLWLRSDMVGGALPVPQAPGTPENLTVTGLSPGLHFFSVRTLDEVNNLSLIGPGGQNRAPTVAGPGYIARTAGQFVDFNVFASDPDLDPLVLTATLPSADAGFIDHDNNSGTFEWQTRATDLGTYTMVTRAEDPNGRIGTLTTTIELLRSGLDCNTNGRDDTDDIITGGSQDCHPNGIPDECDIAAGTSQDCQNNGRPDECDLSGGYSLDNNGNGIPDECEVPAATVVSAVSRKSNPNPGVGGHCGTSIWPVRGSEPHQGGITELRIGFNVPPAAPTGSGVNIEQATCAAPGFVPYGGASTMSGSVVGSELVLNFTPGLENARTYRVHLGPQVTSVAGQVVEIRGLVGDVNGDGFVNGTDRSVVVGAWTGTGFTCPTDLNTDGGTNATDRSLVVGAWTGAQNCAP